MNNTLPWEIKKIISVANALVSTGQTTGSTSEVIAAAFVLNRMEFLPPCDNDIIEAWERLDEQWQEYVKMIKKYYRAHLVPW